MAPNLRLNAVAFISPQNHPILIRTFAKQDEHSIKYHYIAHTSLDVIEERVNAGGKATECYLGLLYAMEDVAVYGYITPLKVKIVLALALSDSVVRDVEITMIFKALHMAYYSAISNPFLRLDVSTDVAHDHSPYLLVGSPKWKNFRMRIDEINRVVGNTSNPVSNP
ncbi:Sedlin, N-terminal conserved region-domain-containing protein [Lyophyllum atratum]|nr:Sedlin, N-terminal conserved region-domain-containing protein [Lyophyllum atratum]